MGSGCRIRRMGEITVESLGMALYRLSCGLLAARGHWFPAWDALSQADKDYWESLASQFGEFLQ